jgi:hypothetical protein
MGAYAYLSVHPRRRFSRAKAGKVALNRRFRFDLDSRRQRADALRFADEVAQCSVERIHEASALRAADIQALCEHRMLSEPTQLGCRCVPRECGHEVSTRREIVMLSISKRRQSGVIGLDGGVFRAASLSLSSLPVCNSQTLKLRTLTQSCVDVAPPRVRKRAAPAPAA